MAVADLGIRELQEHVDSLITIPNEKLLSVLGKNTSLMTAFKAANDVLLGAVQGIADLIIRPGMINVDFADVRTVMSEMGAAMMGTGVARGENRAREAAEMAIRSPLLEDVDLQGARGILVNITAGLDLSLGEFTEVGDIIEEFASESATVVVGTVIDPEMRDELKVTVVATGLGMATASASVQDVSFKVVETKKPLAEPTPVVYRDLDRPTVMRNQQSAAVAREVAARPAPLAEPDMEYLDIPAFLRRQAD
jgi:cell division protein FtsZ